MNPGEDSTLSTLESFRAVLAPSEPPCATSSHTPGHPAPSLGLVLVKDTSLYHNSDIIPALSWENKEEVQIPAPRPWVPREVLERFGPNGAQGRVCSRSLVLTAAWL